MSKIVNAYNLGRLEYSKALKVQKYLLNQYIQKQKDNNQNERSNLDSILLVEHEPVYTIGIRRDAYKNLDLDKFKSLNAQIEYTDRGGLITFHGPGQLVAYPIINLKNFKPSLKWYVSQLEQTVINLCKNDFGLKAYRLCSIGYTGVWANDAKLAAIGVHCKQYITYHGLALNCNVDLKWFEHIVPCGIQDKRVSSLSDQLGKNINFNTILPIYLKNFSNVFECEIVDKSSKETDELINNSI